MSLKKILVIGGVLLVAVLGVFVLRGRDLGTAGSQSNSSNKTIEIGSPAPPISLETFDGETVSLADQKGKAVFVDFWAAWCPFCIEEMPEIQKISEEFGDDLVVWGVHRSETESVERGAKFAKERGVTYPLLKDTDGSSYKVYAGGRNFMPAAVFINKEGVVVKTLFGPKTVEQMREDVMKALGETI
jgi:peroxiredoxin